MTVFTVTWRGTTDARLAELWLNAPDRKTVTATANEIDRLLRTDPHRCGRKFSDQLYEWVYPPLVVLYRVSEPDRLVEVMDVDTTV
jgi:hypothetical protein